MAENKFIKHLKGTETAGSVLEIKNQGTPATFGNMPAGTSNPNTVYADARGDATGVLKGTDNWKLDGSTLTLATQVYGDGRDLTGTYTASGNTLWVNGVYTFGSAKIFSPNTKWVLKLCGSNLLSGSSDTIDFSLVIKFGGLPVIAKTFTVAERANNFCQQFVVDFDEGEATVIRAMAGDTMTIQLLCGDSTASATIYNGMTTLTALQRRVDGDVVASDTSTFDDLEQGLAGKVDKVSTPSVVYGTDATGAQTTYDLDDLGGVTDVQVDGVSIVQNKIADIPMATYLGDYVLKAGDTMTGDLLFTRTDPFSTSKRIVFDEVDPVYNRVTIAKRTALNANTGDQILHFYGGKSVSVYADFYMDFVQRAFFCQQADATLGSQYYPWAKAYITKINNGGDLAVPAVSGTLATKADVDLAANSGRMITDQGVWYAKMDALGTIPSSAEVEGRNYADFTQVDGNNDPIIVIYTYTSGAWVQTETITPPSAYDGYVPITSKIWDIPEQTGQQGGRILWNHTSKDFTPYPMIVSFDGANITNGAFQGSADLSGTSTVTMPATPSSTQIVNKNYVDTAIAAIPSGAFDLFDIKWRDSTTSNTAWALSDGNWKTNATAYQHLVDDYDNISSYLHSMGTVSGVNYYSDPSRDVPGATYEYAFSSFDETTVTTVYSNTSAPEGGTDHFYNGSGSGATDLGVLDGSGQASTSLKSTIAYEKIGNTTVVYVTAADGHKICLPDQETNVDAIYAATGVAWYYILDTANQRFMLPRTKFGVTGLRDTVGNYVEPALPEISGSFQFIGPNPNSHAGGVSGAFSKDAYSQGISNGIATGTWWSGGWGTRTTGFKASRSSDIYKDGATVQPPATQMYLYFYVGS